MTPRGGPQHIPRPELWTPGRPAPWSGLGPRERQVGLERVATIFDGRVGEPSPVMSEGGSPSAVLVALYDDDDPVVILTRRAWHLRRHKGEVSFPGGRADADETHSEAALREAHEEIALPPDVPRVLGELDHLSTVTRRAYIAPVVAVLDGSPDLRPSDAEVDAILRVRLSELTEPGVFREERWGTVENGRPIYFFDLVGDTVWGATASMLRHFLVLVLGLDPGPPEDHDPARGIGWYPPLPPGLADEVV